MILLRRQRAGSVASLQMQEQLKQQVHLAGTAVRTLSDIKMAVAAV